MSDFWATERAVDPALVEMLSNENRNITLNLSPFVITPEVVTGTPTVDVLDWRTRDALDQSAIGTLTYNTSSKVVTVKIDATKLPVRQHVAVRAQFVVGGNQRSAYVVVWIPL